MMLYTDRRVTSCFHLASDIIEERTGLRLPLPKPDMGKKRDEKEIYKKQLQEANISIRPIKEIEDNALILFQNPMGFHVGVCISDMDNRIVHGATGEKSRSSTMTQMKRTYKVIAIYKIEKGQPGDFDENLPKAELFDPGSIALIAILALGAGRIIRNWIDRQDRDLPDRDISNLFNLTGGRNETRHDQALPLPMGRIRVFPDFSILPYNRYRGQNDAPIQEWLAGLNFGVGRMRMSSLRLGDTDFLQFLGFGSPNSFETIGEPGVSAPSYWRDNVGGARSRTQEFSTFRELDYRAPFLIAFSASDVGAETSFVGSDAVGFGIEGVRGTTDLSETAAGREAIQTAAFRLSLGDSISAIQDDIINDLLADPPLGFTGNVVDVAAEIIGAAVRGDDGSGVGGGAGRGGDSGGDRGGSGFGGPGEGNPGDNEGPGGGGGGGDN